MAEKYQSRFSGEDLDRAIEIILSGQNTSSGHQIIDTSINNKADLNEIIEPSIYSIEYYINGYADSSDTYKPIHLCVADANENYRIQSYKIGNKEVYRYYRIEDELFTEWKVRESVKVVSSNEMVSVDAPTLIIREDGDEINAEPGFLHK